MSSTNSFTDESVSKYEVDGAPSNNNNNNNDRLSNIISHAHSEQSLNEGVQRVITRLEEDAGSLGPLEQPYDLVKVITHPDPQSTFNDADEWKYPVDQETNLRIVEFVEGDKLNPKNLSVAHKWMITFLLGSVCLVVALGSAIVTGDIELPCAYFGVSLEVMILSEVTVFVLGFGFGPLLFAGLSEELGRNAVYLSTLALAVIFIIPCAVARNIATLLICRLIDGIFFSAPMTLIGGSLADIWAIQERGKAMAIFSAAPFLGPVLGPVLGAGCSLITRGYENASPSENWRWVYWVFLLISFTIYLLFLAFIPETHASTILKRRAKKLRTVTGDDSYKALCELKTRSVAEIAKVSALRPLILLQELIVFLMTLYMSVVYGLLYMFFFAYPVVFQEGKGFSAVITGVMFLPIGGGVLLATAIAPFINKDYNRRAAAYRDRGELPPPELRLIPMMYSCWTIPIGMFSFAWSSYTWISWAGPCFSGLAVGFGFCTLYNPANNYIVDSYQHYAASGLAAKTFVRSVWGACVPLFTIQMYHRLGDQWASSLMAFISLACCAIPYMFYFFGARIRKHSKYAYAPEMDEKH